MAFQFPGGFNPMQGLQGLQGLFGGQSGSSSNGSSGETGQQESVGIQKIAQDFQQIAQGFMGGFFGGPKS